MSISCSCDDFDYEAGDWWCERATDYESMPQRQRRKRCCSCNKLLDTGETVLRFNRWRGPLNDIEYDIHGDEVPMAPFFMCEECGEIYDNLSATGMCIGFDDSMRENLRQYWEMTGFDPSKYATDNSSCAGVQNG